MHSIETQAMSYYYSTVSRTGKKQADHLIKSYIGSASATPVNLPGELEHEIMSQYKSRQITNKLFVKAETAIRDLLRYDSYRRFLKSASFLWIEVSNLVLSLYKFTKWPI